ncbi:MAG: PAS domain S-box protein [Aphanothece sp. CMT-3BRIN-NPC111]|jgi:hypothetical protein|nr:PAS domain S-box protein [Aphanothece sp. CMT-3BRIN-NPC111]
MLQFLQNFIYSGQFIPHGHCYLWKPGLVWLHVLSDSLIAIAYYSIPITLVYFVRKRQDLPFNWIFMLFGAFIIACGTTHIMEIWTLWHPTYWLSGFIKAITALVSVYTAVELVPLVPKALALPSPEQLEAANQKLHKEIIAHKAVQEALRNSEDLFRRLTACSPIGIFISDTEGNCSYTNPKYQAISGLTLTETLAQGWIKSIHPEDRSSVLSGWLAATGEASEYSGQFRCQTPQGMVRWVDARTSPIHSDVGKLLGYVGTVEDITERKQAEAERDRFFTLSVDLLCIAGIDSYFKRLNPAFEKTLGYTQEELLSKPFLDFVHPEDVAATIAEVEKLATGIPSIYFENRYRCKDGSYKWLAWTSSPDRESGFLYAIARDMTAQKQAEEELQSISLALENAVEGISRLDTQGRYIMVNKAYASTIGYQPEETIGMSWQQTAHPEDCEKMIAAYQQMLANGKVQVETRGVRKDGSIFYKEVVMIGAYDSKEQFIGHYCFMKDITERKQIEKELALRSVELERSNAELEKFAYVASHDLQEPLRMVASYTQLLARRYQGKLDTDADEFIDYVVDGVKRMQVLINDLLAYSRVGTRGKSFEPINCELIFERAVKNLQIAREDAGAAIAHSPLPTVMGDSSQLLQLFQNLIGNAIKFSGDRPPCIQIAAEPRTNEWIFSVRDNGIGIAPEYTERIFEIFQRLHTRDQYPGTGIGLAICKKIVERHGGKIWVETELPQGSIFYFTLPMVQIDNHASPNNG